MKRYLSIIVLAAVAMTAGAATVENDFFRISTPDDSWFLTNDDALRPYGARVDIARVDARGATLELARIDYIEGAFDPRLYLTKQVVEKKDVFCRTATDFTDVYESRIAGYDCQSVQFKKSSNGYGYDCEAMTYNAGYGTFLIIMAHRSGNPSLVGRIVETMTYKFDTAPMTTAARLVAAAQQVVKKHHLPIGSNEHLSGVDLSSDSSTVTLKVTVPYITKENVNVPAFVMTKRDAWFRQAPEALKFNLLLAAITRERKNLRYLYVDTKGNEIGTLLIMPEEYEQVERLEAERIEREAKAREAAVKAQQEERAKQEAAEQARIQEEQRKAAEAAANAPITHVVKSGDSLTKIAKQYSVTVNEIKRLNPNIKSDKINIGQKIVIR